MTKIRNIEREGIKFWKFDIQISGLFRFSIFEFRIFGLWI